jgi:hypothetical protein
VSKRKTNLGAGEWRQANDDLDHQRETVTPWVTLWCATSTPACPRFTRSRGAAEGGTAANL